MPKAKKKAEKKATNGTELVPLHTAPVSLAEAIEKVLISGDLAPLSIDQRLEYYRAMCKSLGLNPLTRPFDYVTYQGKLTLYARRDCADQLRRLHGVSVTRLSSEVVEGLCVAKVEVRDKLGRTDAASGAVWVKSVTGLELANALMKAETKAKRRATLSICGLGFLDESEVGSVEDYNMVSPEGRIIHEASETGSNEAAQAAGRQKIEELKQKIETRRQEQSVGATGQRETVSDRAASQPQTTGTGPQTHPERGTLVLESIGDGLIAIRGVDLSLVKTEYGDVPWINWNDGAKAQVIPESMIYDFAAMCSKVGVKALDANGKVVSKSKPATEAVERPGGKLSGKITGVSKQLTTKNQKPYLEIYLNGNEQHPGTRLSLFDMKAVPVDGNGVNLWDLLLKSKNAQAEFITETKKHTETNENYLKVLGVTRVGPLEWDAESGEQVISANREVGPQGGKLF